MLLFRIKPFPETVMWCEDCDNFLLFKFNGLVILLVEWLYFVVVVVVFIESTPNHRITGMDIKTLFPPKMKCTHFAFGPIQPPSFYSLFERNGGRMNAPLKEWHGTIHRHLKTKWISIRLKKQSLRITVTCGEKQQQQ